MEIKNRFIGEAGRLTAAVPKMYINKFAIITENGKTPSLKSLRHFRAQKDHIQWKTEYSARNIAKKWVFMVSIVSVKYLYFYWFRT